jgi:hypothetical protein
MIPPYSVASPIHGHIFRTQACINLVGADADPKSLSQYTSDSEDKGDILLLVVAVTAVVGSSPDALCIG